MIKRIFIKYFQLIKYTFFGALTVAVNMLCYLFLYQCVQFSNILSTIVAWIAAVIFAYITNKFFVFDSKSCDVKVLIKEALSFLGCRLLTGILDVIIMYVAVDIMMMNSMVWKFISNLLVIVLNYIASKLVIFKK